MGPKWPKIDAAGSLLLQTGPSRADRVPFFQTGFRCRRGESLLSGQEAIARRGCPDDRIGRDGVHNGPRMQDDQDKKNGRDVKDSRQQRLKLALRENLKRRKSQARGRSDEAAASSESADASLDDAGGEKPG